MLAIRSFPDLLATARRPPMAAIAVAGAHEAEVLRSAVDSWRLGLARPFLVGPESRIREQAEDAGLDLGGCEIVNRDGAPAVAQTAVDLVRTGEAQVAVKGLISSTAFLHAALARGSGLRTERLVSHVGVFQIPGFPRLLCISDGGVVLYPDPEQKTEIIRNAIDVARALGQERPRVALVAGANEVTLARPATREIAGLVAMSALWETLSTRVDGPFTLDVAVDPAAAATVGKAGEVAGEADVLVGPTLEATNTMCKGITYFAGGQMAGIVVGTQRPLALGSRADAAETRLACIAMGVLFAKKQSEAT